MGRPLPRNAAPRAASLWRPSSTQLSGRQPCRSQRMPPRAAAILPHFSAPGWVGRHWAGRQSTATHPPTIATDPFRIDTPSFAPALECAPSRPSSPAQVESASKLAEELASLSAAVHGRRVARSDSAATVLPVEPVPNAASPAVREEVVVEVDARVAPRPPKAPAKPTAMKQLSPAPAIAVSGYGSQGSVESDEELSPRAGPRGSNGRSSDDEDEDALSNLRDKLVSMSSAKAVLEAKLALKDDALRAATSALQIIGSDPLCAPPIAAAATAAATAASAALDAASMAGAVVTDTATPAAAAAAAPAPMVLEPQGVEAPPPAPAEINPGFVPGRPMAGFTNSGVILRPGDGTEFSVRIGPDYKRHGKKAPSVAHVYEVVSADIFKRPKIQLDVSSLMNLPPPPDATVSNDSGLPRRLVINGVPGLCILQWQKPRNDDSLPAAPQGLIHCICLATATRALCI